MQSSPEKEFVALHDAASVGDSLVRLYANRLKESDLSESKLRQQLRDYLVELSGKLTVTGQLLNEQKSLSSGDAQASELEASLEEVLCAMLALNRCFWALLVDLDDSGVSILGDEGSLADVGTNIQKTLRYFANKNGASPKYAW